MKKLLVVKKINALQTFSLISKYLLFLVLLCLTNSCKKEILTDSKQSLLASAKVASVGIQSQQCDQWTYLGSVEVVCPCEGHHVGDASCRCHTQAYMEYYFSLSSCSPPSGGGSVTVVSSEIYPNNGGGGGGGVVPYPTGPNLLPLDYNPDCENQRRAMLLPPPGDDGCAILPNRPLINRINRLAIHLDLSLNELEWLYRNETLVGEIERSMENYYVDDGFRAAVHFALQLDQYNSSSITDAELDDLLLLLPLSYRSYRYIIRPYLKQFYLLEQQIDSSINSTIAYFRAINNLLHQKVDFSTLVPFNNIVNLDPSANSNIDDNNNYTTTGYDNTIYFEYQQTDPWPTVNPENIIPIRNWVGLKNESDNCFKLAKQQMAKNGLQISAWGASGQTYQAYTTAGGVNASETKKGISYIIDCLSKGKPVLVGVDNRPGSPNIDTDNSTDHFIVIVGMGIEKDGRKFFQFYDSATSSALLGASHHNKLYYNISAGKITGKTVAPYGQSPGMHDYIVTQIRKSKPL